MTHYLPSTILIAAALGLVLLLLSAEDLRSRRIPDVLSLPLILAGIAGAAAWSDQAVAVHAIGAVVGYATLAMLGEVYFRTRGREGLGLGDAKLFAAAGAWLGWPALPFVLLAASALGLITVLLLGIAGRQTREIPFGPALSLAFWMIFIWGAPGLPITWR